MRAVAVAAVLLLALLLPTGTSASGHRHRIGLVLPTTATLYKGPSRNASVLAELVQQTQVTVLRTQKAWRRVRVWGSLKGWLPRQSVTFRKPWKTTSTYRPPTVHYRVRAHGSRPLQVRAVVTGTAPVVAWKGRRAAQSLSAGARVSVRAWRQDSGGHIWYGVDGLWTRGPLRFTLPRPAGNWKLAAGKGMWVTLGTVTGTRPDALVRAARGDGVTHLYIEAAISPWGFHGRDSVGPLIEAAHRNHIAVIAWVYPYLDDIASDVDLTLAVSAYRTAGGEQFDGIAADLERNMDTEHLRNYSQIVRRILGPARLLIGVTYPPQSIPTYPFGEVAPFYDVIAPMDYWHQTRTSTGLDYGHMAYGYDYAYRYARDSIRAIRATGAAGPIMPIGQTFDNFGRLEMGPYAPSAAEITGFLRGARDSGAQGASFFQWMTATEPEWRAIRGFRFK